MKVISVITEGTLIDRLPKHVCGKAEENGPELSCQTRNSCSSCLQKPAVLLAEKLREEILAPLHHRHWIFTIPVSLRQLFLRERILLGILPRCAFLTIKRTFAADRVHESDDGQVLLDIPPDHRTGATSLSLDPMEWMRRTTHQIPGKGTHLVRYFSPAAQTGVGPSA